MLGTSRIIALVTTADPARALAFYRDVLGLSLVADESFALVFDAAGTMLRVAKAGSVAPPPYSVLGWRVDDARATVRGLAARGVVLERFEGMGQDEDGIWASPDGALVAWFKDPDGNLLSIAQM